MRIYILLLTIIFAGCDDKRLNSNNPPKQMIFNWYGNTDSIVKASVFKLNIYSNNVFDSIIVIADDTVSFNIRQVFDSSGVYRYCDGEKIKTHSLEDTLITVIPERCKMYHPFINKIVSYRGNKIYQVNGKQYRVYHFSEDSDKSDHSKTYHSYYLGKTGSICYYSFDTDEYLLCDSLSGFETDSRTIREIKYKLLKDTTFFARHILNKVLPNFHRPDFHR